MDSRSIRGKSGPTSFDSPIRVGIMTGTFHGVLAMSLWYFFDFEGVGRMLATEPFVLVYTLSGMFLLGVIPGLLYAKWKTISPGVLVGGMVCLSSYSTWNLVREGLTPVDPTPYGWYVLLWVGIAVVITVSGLVERRLTG